MSWSISKELKNDPSDMFTSNKIQQLREFDKTNLGNQHCAMERDHQIDAAINAAALLLAQGGFVDHADEISVSLAGHANKDHQKDDSWANEYISIQVHVKSYRPSSEG